MADAASGEVEAPVGERPTTFTRDLGQTRGALERWLATRRPDVDGVRVSDLVIPETNGMSSETLLFDAVWVEDGSERVEPMVARVAPDPQNVPVFRDYDLAGQFEVMHQVALLTSVPVPRVHWLERAPHALGAPFLVMERRRGIVPPDLLPYPFGDNWLFDASRADQRTLQDSTVAVLAALHAIERPEDRFPFLDLDRPERTALGRHVGDWEDYYEWIVADGRRSPLIESCLAWLHEHWPADDSGAVFNWGDARVGNVMYRDFRPIAVLDWEMAAIAPREIDLTYCVYLHRMFDDAASKYGFPGMPDFMTRDDALGEYERLTGHAARDFEWYAFWNATRYGMVSARIGRRSARFGEQPMPDDIDDVIMNRDALERMLAGTYWNEV